MNEGESCFGLAAGKKSELELRSTRSWSYPAFGSYIFSPFPGPLGSWGVFDAWFPGVNGNRKDDLNTTVVLAQG